MAPASKTVVVTFLATALFAVCSADYPYKEKYTAQYVDHFNYKNKGTFPARYLLSGSSPLSPGSSTGASPGASTGAAWYYLKCTGTFYYAAALSIHVSSYLLAAVSARFLLSRL